MPVNAPATRAGKGSLGAVLVPLGLLAGAVLVIVFPDLFADLLKKALNSLRSPAAFNYPSQQRTAVSPSQSVHSSPILGVSPSEPPSLISIPKLVTDGRLHHAEKGFVYQEDPMPSQKSNSFPEMGYTERKPRVIYTAN